MNKEELVYYVESLGFKRNHKDKYFINPQDKEFYLFDGKDDVIVEVIKVMDYYTSYWGNHPYHEEIRIYMKSSVTAHQELYSAKLSVMDFYRLVEAIDYAFSRYAFSRLSVTRFASSEKKYRVLRDSLKSQINRDNKLRDLGV